MLHLCSAIMNFSLMHSHSLISFRQMYNIPWNNIFYLDFSYHPHESPFDMISLPLFLLERERSVADKKVRYKEDNGGIYPLLYVTSSLGMSNKGVGIAFKVGWLSLRIFSSDRKKSFKLEFFNEISRTKIHYFLRNQFGRTLLLFFHSVDSISAATRNSWCLYRNSHRVSECSRWRRSHLGRFVIII